ncbi:Protein of unknown function DUF1749 [Penicillium cf. griseofulvum]|uniref:Uncharacterized protein n=1 Tax=Penicillium cf. griseofulvum TaxID=2972120 RepID=A0A9W9J0S1_9EURO|nr:Protein of unknown function DUF1749 [Penicillium cf. griseofulvum]KAJ5434247.1 Protein of unknown function DUF1749 [Penicillium cf. griseofulvum]KAJ5452075.1 Protein of unknown function DUF1749 [Penicillium cf. griseofulvum]
MSSHAARGPSHNGVLHEYAPKLVAFEFTPPAEGMNKTNSLIFVGGLTDGFCTVPYVSKLAKALENTEWSVFSVLLSSSYAGWGVGSLDRDVEELGQCVRFIRDLKASRQPGPLAKAAKIAIMGHSTGSQDVLHYLYSPNPLPQKEFDLGLQHMVRPELDGAILQAPASDREGLQAIINSSEQPDELRKVYNQLVGFAKEQTYTADKKDTILPMNLTAKLSYPPDTPLSARRFLSLVSPQSPDDPSDDDLFSSDLSDERLQKTFGMVGTQGIIKSKLLFLYSGEDEYCPSWVDKEKLLQRWQQATEAGGAQWDAGNSGVIPGASHNVHGEGQQDLIDRVLRYLQAL